MLPLVKSLVNDYSHGKHYAYSIKHEEVIIIMTTSMMMMVTADLANVRIFKDNN